MRPTSDSQKQILASYLPGLIGARECRGQPSGASPSWGWTRGWGSSQVPHPYYRLTGWFVWVYRLLVAHESNLHIQGLQCIVQGSRALKYRPYFFQSSEMLDHRKIAIEQNESAKRYCALYAWPPSTWKQSTEWGSLCWRFSSERTSVAMRVDTTFYQIFFSKWKPLTRFHIKAPRMTEMKTFFIHSFHRIHTSEQVSRDKYVYKA